MKTVYRIESQDYGTGPYMAKHEMDISLVQRLDKMHEVHNRYVDIFPGLQRDFLLKDIVKIRSCKTHEVESLFGFTSIEKLQQWFNVYIKDLLKSGFFVIKEYKVNEDQVFESISGKQCVFIINRKVEGMGKVVPFEVTEAMQLNYVNMYEEMLEDYWN